MGNNNDLSSSPSIAALLGLQQASLQLCHQREYDIFLLTCCRPPILKAKQFNVGFTLPLCFFSNVHQILVHQFDPSWRECRQVRSRKGQGTKRNSQLEVARQH